MFNICTASTSLKDLCDQSSSGCGLVLPVGLELTNAAIVASKSVDAGFDQNQAELGVLVLLGHVQVLLDRDSLLDQHVQIFRDGRCQAILLQHTQDLGSGDSLYLGDSGGITENNTDLGRGKTLLCQLVDVVLNLGGGGLNPRSRGALVWEGTLRDTLSWCVHASHLRCKRMGQGGDMRREERLEGNEGARIVRTPD